MSEILGLPEAEPAGHRRDRRAARIRGLDLRWVVGVTVFAGTLAQPARPFRYDALGYWLAAGTLTEDPASSLPPGYYDLRGVTTAVFFTPAQMLSRVLGDTSDGFAVLVQNSLLIAFIAAFLLPALARPWRRPGPVGSWVMAGSTWLVLKGFAPYPLLDLYAAAAVLGAVVLLRRSSWATLAGAGALLGLAFNARPAYLLAGVLLGVVACWRHRLRGLLVLAGAAVALVPQAVYNIVTDGTIGVLPPASSALTGLQTAYASYVIRYDTAVEQAVPQQFFCSPEMADSVGVPPTDVAGLGTDMVTGLPHSAVFALEKIGAALHWPLSAPYFSYQPVLDAVFAVVVTAVTVLGLVALSRRPPVGDGEGDGGRGAVAHGALVAAVVVATLITLVGSATEARFALPLVLLGLAGIGTISAPRTKMPRHALVRPVTAIVLVVGTLVLGWSGLAHPAPPGDAAVSTCAGDLR